MKNDKPQFTLHKLPEGFIVTSDEKIRENDFYFWEVDKKIHQQNKFPEENFIYNDWKYNRHKVIAQQDQIDFPSLSPEMQKEIGYFDAELYYPKLDVTTHEDTINIYRREGFQKALELLSDRTFTKKDMFKLMEHLRDTESRMMFEVETRMFVSKPKSWRVELEMEKYEEGHVDDFSQPHSISYRPKFTDGKIKITKLWLI